MNRIYHFHVGWTSYFVVLFLASQMFYFFWTKEIVVAVLITLLEIFFIEMMIHTAYTITQSGTLVISKGKFFPVQEIPVKDIVRIEDASTPFSKKRVRLTYHGKYKDEKVTLAPAKKEDFVASLLKAHPEIVAEQMNLNL